MLNAAHCLISQDITSQTVFGELREEIWKKYFSAFIPRLSFNTFLLLSYVTFRCKLNNRALIFSSVYSSTGLQTEKRNYKRVWK